MRARGIVALIAAQLVLVGGATIMLLPFSASYAGAVALSGAMVSIACWLGAWIATRPSGHSAHLALWRLVLGEAVKVALILAAIGWLLLHPEFKPLGVLAGMSIALVGYALSFVLLKR
jgi:ATP synthase I chain